MPAPAIAALAAFATLWLVGCSQIDLGFLSSLGAEPVEEGAAIETAGGSAGSPLELVGESAGAVERVLGEPRGRLHTVEGVVWLYPQWRVQFNAERRVINVERELGTQVQAGRDAVSPARVSPPTQRQITVVSNGGQEVDLAALLAPGKITVVDFYADWCGPCRQVSPHLERLAREDPDVNLVKVDIVKWGTPVTRQFSIRSVPNIRVYNRAGRTVGAPTSDFRQVLRNVEQAKQ